MKQGSREIGIREMKQGLRCSLVPASSPWSLLLLPGPCFFSLVPASSPSPLSSMTDAAMPRIGMLRQAERGGREPLRGAEGVDQAEAVAVVDAGRAEVDCRGSERAGNLFCGGGWRQRPRQRRGPGHVRRRHRRPTEEAVIVAIRGKGDDLFLRIATITASSV